MKRNQFGILLLFLMLSFACKQNEADEQKLTSWKIIDIETSISDSKSTARQLRTNDLSTDNLSQIGFGFFATYGTQDETLTGGWYENEKVIRNNGVWGSQSGTDLNWKNADQLYSVYAYAPYVLQSNNSLSWDGDTLAISMPADQSSASVQNQIDLLQWHAAEDFKPSDLNEAALNIDFRHQMAKIQMRVNAGDRVIHGEDLTTETFRMKNVIGQAEFYPATGEFSLNTSAQKLEKVEAKYEKSTYNTYATYELLILPQSTDELSFEFRLDDQVYTINLAELRVGGKEFTKLEKGTHYSFEVTLHREDATDPNPVDPLEMNLGNVNIVSWDYKNINLGDIGKTDPVDNDYTLFQAIENVTIESQNETEINYLVNIGVDFDMSATFEYPENVPTLFRQAVQGKTNTQVIRSLDIFVKTYHNIDLSTNVKLHISMNDYVGELPDALFYSSGQNLWLKEFSAPLATSIGENTFNNCRNLTKVNLLAVTTCGDRGFNNCRSLKNLYLPLATTFGDNSIYYCKNLNSVDLPLAETFGNGAFYETGGWDMEGTDSRSIYLPHATTFGDNAFYQCYSLNSVELPLATTFGYNAFYNCSSLKSVELPLATTFGNSAFNGCYYLNSVELPLATTFGNSAFYNCNQLETVTFPSLTTIGSAAFSSCNKLKSVELPVATSIGNSPFSGSGSLNTVKLGAVTSVNFGTMPSTPASSGIVIYLNGVEYDAADTDQNLWKNNTWLAILPYETEE